MSNKKSITPEAYFVMLNADPRFGEAPKRGRGYIIGGFSPPRTAWMWRRREARGRTSSEDGV